MNQPGRFRFPTTQIQIVNLSEEQATQPAPPKRLPPNHNHAGETPEKRRSRFQAARTAAGTPATDIFNLAS
jgi:hypothetical protein